MYLMNYGR